MDVPLRAIIVDDEPEVIANLENLLLECPRIELIGTIGSAKNAIEQIELLQPDLIFTDIQMPEKNGFELVTTNIGSLEKMLPPGQFFRISRSIIINVAYLTRVSRKKRTAFLSKDGKEYTFKIPLLNIRKLERFREGR